MARRRRAPIKIKKSNRGKLRRAAGAKKGKRIPMKKLQQMKRSKNPKTRKRANFAINARKWKKGGRRRK
jgi:oligoendopeptidase F